MKCPMEACNRKMNNSYHNLVINSDKKKKMKLKDIFEKPPNSHMMADGVVMSGKTHNAKSKVLGKLKKKKNKKPKY